MSKATTKRKRPLSYLSLLMWSAVGGLVMGGIFALVTSLFGPPHDLAVIVLGLGVVAVVMVTTLMWWRGADEAVREAHKWAWWWGGSTGLGVGMILYFVADLNDAGSPLIDWLARVAGGEFQAGLISVIGFQLVGYIVSWATWWMKHR